MGSALPGARQTDLVGDGDDVGLPQLGHGLDHGGRGVGREVRGGVGDG